MVSGELSIFYRPFFFKTNKRLLSKKSVLAAYCLSDIMPKQKLRPFFSRMKLDEPKQVKNTNKTETFRHLNSFSLNNASIEIFLELSLQNTECLRSIGTPTLFSSRIRALSFILKKLNTKLRFCKEVFLSSFKTFYMVYFYEKTIGQAGQKFKKSTNFQNVHLAFQDY